MVPYITKKKMYVYLLQIAAVFYYLCVVTLQFVAPLMICLFFTLMYKTLGKRIGIQSHGSRSNL